MKLKRLFAIITVVAVLASSMMLAGCGDKTASGEPYTIHWYHVTGTAPADETGVEAAVDAYLQEKGLNAKLDLHYLSWTPYAEKMNVMIAGGDKFDICYQSGDSYRMKASKGAFLPLNDLLKKYAPKTLEMLGEDFLSGSAINGVNYGIPANKDRGHAQGMIYRVDLAEKHGLVDIIENAKTIDDLYPAFDVILEKEPGITPMVDAATNSTSGLIDAVMAVNPVGYIPSRGEENIEFVNVHASEEWKELIRKTAEHRAKGYTEKGVNVGGNETVFMEFQGYKPGKGGEMSGGRKYQYKEIALTEPTMATGDTTGSLMCISRTSENPEICMQFLELFNTDKYLNNLIVYGIEGTHYEKLEGEYIRPIKNSGYGNAGMQWEHGNVFLNYLTEGEPADKWERMTEFNESLKPSPVLGFMFDVTPVSAEAGACANTYDEYGKRLQSGDVPNGDWESLYNEYLEKLEACGVDRIVEEANRQYQEWVKAVK